MPDALDHIIPVESDDLCKQCDLWGAFMLLWCLVTKSSLILATLWTLAYRAPLSKRFSRREYWSEMPFPSPGDLPDPGIEPRSPALQVDSLPTELPGDWNLSSSGWLCRLCMLCD